MLWTKRDAIVGNFTSVTVSVFEDDEEQYETIMKFAEFKGNESPMIYIKFLGDYETDRFPFPTFEKVNT